MKHRLGRIVAVLALMFASIGVATTPASAHHQWDFGWWDRAPYVAWDGQYASNIQDGAYYWQDRGFSYGYVPPLPGYNHGGVSCGTFWDRYINACTVPRNVVESYCGQVCNGWTQTNWYSGGRLLGGFILIADDLYPELRQTTWRHEFGHAIGLGEWWNDSSCVMYPAANVLGETCGHDWDAVDEMY